MSVEKFDVSDEPRHATAATHESSVAAASHEGRKNVTAFSLETTTEFQTRAEKALFAFMENHAEGGITGTTTSTSAPSTTMKTRPTTTTTTTTTGPQKIYIQEVEEITDEVDEAAGQLERKALHSNAPSPQQLYPAEEKASALEKTSRAEQGYETTEASSNDSSKMVVEYLEEAELARSFPSTKWNVYEDKVLNTQISSAQGCQMVHFQTKNPNLGKFWNALHWKMLIYLMAICNISGTFGVFYGHLVHFVSVWFIFPVLV
jgi:hypothetical protein